MHVVFRLNYSIFFNREIRHVRLGDGDDANNKAFFGHPRCTITAQIIADHF